MNEQKMESLYDILRDIHQRVITMGDDVRSVKEGCCTETPLNADDKKLNKILVQQQQWHDDFVQRDHMVQAAEHTRKAMMYAAIVTGLLVGVVPVAAKLLGWV